MKKALILFLSLVIFTGCATESVSTKNISQSYTSLSSKCKGWGFRRTNSAPEFTKEQVEEMKKNKCIYMENKGEKTIFLTFDEGYENGYTSLILDTLLQKGVPAAFFVTGAYVKGNGDLVKRMAKEGHIVGNHTLSHPSLPSVSSLEDLSHELFELDRLIYGSCGKTFRFLRPPKGEYSEKTLAFTKDLGYTNVFWSQAYVDWHDNVSKEEAFSKITKNLHNGCVLLLHAVSKGNAESLGDVIDYARKNGYTFKSLDEYSY